MVDIILSIKPEYANKILDGKKKFEFRKQIPKRKITWVYIYASSPNKKIIGRFRLKNEIYGSPKEIWEKCANFGGIKEKDFFSYCGKKEIIHGLEIGEIEEFKKPIDPYNKNLEFKPPQNFVYIQDNCII